MSFFRELRRRNVFRVGAVYIVSAWALLQFVDIVAPLLALPDWAPRLVFVLLAIGLVPALIFAWAYEMTPEGLKKEKEVDRDKSITKSTGRKLDVVVIGVLTVAVALLLFDRFRQPAPEPVAEGGTKSIAVLPFENMSPDPEQEYFSDGITEEILNTLAMVENLKVSGRTSSFAFKNKQFDSRQIGTALGVDHLLAGSVRMAGDTIRITASLIDVRQDDTIWTESYDRKLENVFAIQDEIAEAILSNLTTRLLEGEKAALESRETDPVVLDLYFRAKARLYERTRASVRAGIDLLERAIELDPDYAPAWAQRGIAEQLLADNQYGTTPAAVAAENARRYIDRALELDDRSAEAWAALGLYYTNMPGMHDQAIEALRKSLEIRPSSDASNWLYIALSTSGDMTGALQAVEQMAEIDPLYPPLLTNGATTFNQFGKTDKAEQLLARYRAYDPDDPNLLTAEALHSYLTGEVVRGIRFAERAMQRPDPDAMSHVALSVGLAATNQFERLAEVGVHDFRVQALEALGREREAYDAALSIAERGDLDPLFAHLNRVGRSQYLVDYFDERWSSLAQFAEMHPPTGFGWPSMTDLALAFHRAGDDERFDEAMTYARDAIARLEEDGVHHVPLAVEIAATAALDGQHDKAIAELEYAVAHGMGARLPIVESLPMLETMADDPRLAEIERMIAQNINSNRAELGLESLDLAVGSAL